MVSETRRPCDFSLRVHSLKLALACNNATGYGSFQKECHILRKKNLKYKTFPAFAINFLEAGKIKSIPKTRHFGFGGFDPGTGLGPIFKKNVVWQTMRCF